MGEIVNRNELKMGEMVNRNELLSLFKQEYNRWLREVDRIANAIELFRERGILDTSEETQRFAIEGIRAVDRAYVFDRLYNILSKWDGNGSLEGVDLFNEFWGKKPAWAEDK
jgi:hypothetical protein